MLLRLSVKNCDIVRISKLFAKNGLNADVESSCITVNGTISEEVALELCESANIIGISNYDNKVEKNTESNFAKDVSIGTDSVSDVSKQEDTDKVLSSNDVHPVATLKYPTVKRGDVYICDFGEPFCSEQGYKRYCIVVQNDKGNRYSHTTIVLPCTTAHSAKLPTQKSFFFSEDNMVDIMHSHVSPKENTVLCEQIRAVSKERLINYLGTLTEEFMDTQIQPLIETTVALKPKKQIKKVVKNKGKTVIKRIPSVELSLTQLSLLSYIDVNELISISKTSLTDKEKAEKILQLFGFNLEQNGVSYLLDAIIVSPKKEEFNLKTISKEVSRLHKSMVEPSEVERLIVTRVKENFNMKKSPAIGLIRLVNLMLHKEDANYASNI